MMINLGPSPPHVYETALPPAVRGRYRRAHGEGDLDGEFAVLRLRLRLLEGADAQQDDVGPIAQILRIVDLPIKVPRVPGGRGDEGRAALEGGPGRRDGAGVAQGKLAVRGERKHPFRCCTGRVEWL